MSKKKRIKKGWLCPECNTVYAPTVQKCECVKPIKIDLIGGVSIPFVQTPIYDPPHEIVTIGSAKATISDCIAWYRMEQGTAVPIDSPFKWVRT